MPTHPDYPHLAVDCPPNMTVNEKRARDEAALQAALAVSCAQASESSVVEITEYSFGSTEDLTDDGDESRWDVSISLRGYVANGYRQPSEAVADLRDCLLALAEHLGR